MRRGEIRLVDLDPAVGAKADKIIPAVVVTNDGANGMADRLGRGVVTIVPVTSNISRIHPFQVLLPAGDSGLRQDSKVQAEQVRAVARERVGRRVGQVPHEVMTKVDAALRLHLAL